MISRRSVSRVLTAVLVGTIGASAAYAVEVRNVPGAAFEPGALKLPLDVTERSGVARRGVVVTGGVPFPPGFVHDVRDLGVIDGRGEAVPSQAVVIVRWHEPAYDGSVQWALMSFVADVPASGVSRYYFVDGGRARSPATSLHVQTSPDAVRVDTGAATFTIPASGAALLSRVQMNGRDLLGADGLRGILKPGAWPERGLDPTREHTAFHERVDVEESGPARVVVVMRGEYRPGDNEGRLYGWTARLYFATNSASVRIVYTIDNGRLDPTLVGGWRRTYVWPIDDASLVADLRLDDGAIVTTMGERRGRRTEIAAPAAGHDVTIYQDSSGGPKWKDIDGGEYERWLSPYTQGRTVRGVTFRGYRITAGDETVAAGERHLGVLDISDATQGVAAALRNFAVECPHALGASAKRLRIGLFPGEFAEPFALNEGQRKSWDVRLTFHGRARPGLEECFAEQDTLLLFRPALDWMIRTAATGAWPTGLAMMSPPAGRRAARMSKDRLDGIQVGWDWYGWIGGWNSGGTHWNQSTAFAPWLLWGDGVSFDVAEARTLWAADLCAIHFREPDLAAFWLMMSGWPRWEENRVRRVFFPGYYNRNQWGTPDAGHMAMIMWTEYYLLTGDARAREAWEDLGTRARAICWQYTHDDRRDGTGPGTTAISWCRRRDPDADADFRLATRYVGWPLYDLAQYYRLTGDPQVLDEARVVARAFRNTARYSPYGFMVTQINAKNDGEVYGNQGPFDKGRAESASACYAHFQQGIMATGLVEYYLVSRDAEAMDALMGFADHLCHHAMLRDPSGRRVGWTYAFGDYWGPYTWADLGGQHKAELLGINTYAIQPLGWVALLTGRTDYLDVLRDALRQSYEAPLEIIAAYMATEYPKTDATPPAAIGDLHAEALGGGRVRLTWTAPGGDGHEARAGRYQVKWSTARIVERVEGWPDRTPPLPATRAEWEARAAAFNAKQRAFRAATSAAGAPRPGAAGTHETMTISDLPPGTVHFAIKSWDDADNISDISNVVSVDVRP